MELSGHGKSGNLERWEERPWDRWDFMDWDPRDSGWNFSLVWDLGLGLKRRFRIAFGGSAKFGILGWVFRDCPWFDLEFQPGISTKFGVLVGILGAAHDLAWIFNLIWDLF